MRNNSIFTYLMSVLPLLVASQEVSKSDRAKRIVDDVNKKDPGQYAENFSDDVKVFMYGEDGNFVLRVDGKEAL